MTPLANAPPTVARGPVGSPRSKTLACWLALVGGLFGLQRLYLHGRRDMLAWLCWLPSGLGAYGIWRARVYGLDDRLSWALIPCIGASFSAGALHAILIGLASPAEWNHRMQPGRPEDDPAGSTTRWTVLALVLSMLAGSTALMATIAFAAQRAFESAAP
jgi:hypothetical protein